MMWPEFPSSFKLVLTNLTVTIKLKGFFFIFRSSPVLFSASWEMSELPGLNAA